MTTLLGGLAVVLGGAALSRVVGASGTAGSRIGAISAVAGSVLMLVAALTVLSTGTPVTLTAAWSIPMASFAIEVDRLSAFFLCPILGLSTLCGLYGWGYLRPRDRSVGSGGRSWLWFNLLVASMVLVVLARNAVLFLLAWELMSLTSFFLVAFEHERDPVRHAAWVYLVATHLGGALLLAMFVLIGAKTGSFDFSMWGGLKDASPAFLGMIFLLGLIGFGVKAGIYPLHVWLPEAHPAAPSHVSALMSGVMIKTGIYALIRLVSMLGHPPAWWGWVVVGIGAVSGILGVVSALAQHDIKRLLAYHSVENIGIISLGLGLGLLGWSYNNPVVMTAGFAGGLLHVLNHAVFKGLLFLAAGSVVHATGCRNLEEMGGILRRMPHTGFAFLTGSLAISGLPPLNGFISEFLVYAAAFVAVWKGPPGLIVPATVTVGALAAIGGLAAACFAKVFGIAFLGEPRSQKMADAHECAGIMRGPQFVLAGLCFVIPCTIPWVAPALFSLAAEIASAPVECSGEMGSLTTALGWLAGIAVLFLLLCLAVSMLRYLLLGGRSITHVGTWDCGYARPAPRMQYTASSFAQPITQMFRSVLGLRTHASLPTGFFPRESRFETHASDAANEYIFRPAFRLLERMMAYLCRLQEGRVQVYVLYVALTLLALLLVAL